MRSHADLGPAGLSDALPAVEPNGSIDDALARATDQLGPPRHPVATGGYLVRNHFSRII